MENREAELEQIKEEVKSYQNTVMRQTRELEENKSQSDFVEELKL